MLLRVIERYRLRTEVGKTGDNIAVDLEKKSQLCVCVCVWEGGGGGDCLIWLRIGTGGGIL